MNRRGLLKRAFVLGAAGLLLPIEEPIRRYWSLDRTMLPSQEIDSFGHWPVIGDYPGKPLVRMNDHLWFEDTITVSDSSTFYYGARLLVEQEPMWVAAINGNQVTVLRGPI